MLQGPKESSQRDHRPSGSLPPLVLSVSFGGGASAGSSTRLCLSGHGAGGSSLLRSCHRWDPAATEPEPSPVPSPPTPRSRHGSTLLCPLSFSVLSSLSPLLCTNTSLWHSTSNKNNSKPASSPIVTALLWQFIWGDPFIVPWGYPWEHKK